MLACKCRRDVYQQIVGPCAPCPSCCLGASQETNGQVHASGIVAPMTNEHTVRDWAIYQFPRETMSLHCSTPGFGRKPTITGMVSVFHKRPAIISASTSVNAIPEAIRHVKSLSCACMTVAILQRLSFDVTGLANRFLGYVGSLAAATAAVAVSMRPFECNLSDFHWRSPCGLSCSSIA